MSNDRIERAIDAAGEPPRGGNGGTPGVVAVSVPMLAEAVAVPADGGMRFTQPEEPTGPRILILDVAGGAWRPVILAPGDWSLEQTGEVRPAKPELWTP